MIQKERNPADLQRKTGAKDCQPQGGDHPKVEQDKRPGRNHLRKSQQISRSMTGRSLPDQSHHYRHADHPQ